MVEKIEEEFEEFNDEEEETAEELLEPKKIVRAQTPVKKAVVKREQEQVETVQSQPQFVAVPRAVPVETMINELYDGQQEIKQVLMAILEKLK